MSTRASNIDSSLANKNIVIFLDTFLIGGAEKQAIILADHLQNKLKCNVHVLAFGPGPGSKLIEELGVKWSVYAIDKHCGKLKKIKELIQLTYMLMRLKPDVIMPFTYWPNVYCSAVWKYTGAKTCIWNQRDGGLLITNHLLERMAFKNAPVFVSNSEEGQLFLSEHLNIDPEKINLIHNAVILPEPRNSINELKEKFGVTSEQFIATMIANLHSNKDHETLLRAWKLVCMKSHGNTPMLLLAGRFDQKYETLKKLTEELQITENVKFLGAVDNISGLLKVSQLGVFSSKLEGCPNGVLECMKAGLPVVATNILGVREALGDDYKFLSNINDSESFAEYILEFISNKELRSQVGAVNAKRIDDSFSTASMHAQYGRLITSFFK